MITYRGRRGAVMAVAVGLIASLVLAACGSSDSGADGDGPKVTMSLGHVFPDGSTIDQAADDFVAAVKERTNGRVTINVFPGGQIGSDEEMATALSSGSQEAAILSTGSSGFGERVTLENLPYIVSNFEEADKIFYGDGFMADYNSETMAQNGIHVLEYVENGFRGFSNDKHVVAVPGDMKGMKVRAPSSDLIIGIFENWGSKPVAIPFPELYTALEQGTVDAQENGITLFADSKLDEVQKFYTDTRYIYATALIGVSQKTWDTLSDDQQSILQEEAVKASLAQREEVRASNDEYIAKLRESIEVTVPTDAQFEIWRQSVEPIWDAQAKKRGEELIDDLRAAVEAARS